ncbi:hypothetical protein [Tichowtungia aerotolerans]|uniref:Uncharacterized protein n=1 Tax=Tichowtungia aerotolerans TaxID=2697043 RepID=A0A6P1M9B4_9BACT|nr:hypothetical protein [Tichowtungia aerotolerans]QHI70622.1 hypothetical protein GT409_14630 [Tichowtungia aerotolerans]
MKSMFSKWFAALIAVLCTFSASAQIVVSGSADHYQSSNLDSNTISAFETAAGNNRKLVLVATWEGNAIGITNISYGSQTFSEAYSVANSHRMVSIWYLDAPDIGTQDIVAQWNGADTTRIGVLSLQNAAPGGPLLTDSEADSLSIDVTTTVSNTFVLGVYNENNGGIAVSSTSFSNILYTGASGSCEVLAGYHNEASPGLKSYSFTADTYQCIIGVVGFQEAPPSSTLAVDFGGDYRDSNVSLDETLDYETGDFDFGTAGEDRRGYRDISSAFYTIVPSGGTGAPGDTKTFYAGAQIANFGSLTDSALGLYRYSASADSLQVTSDVGTSNMGLVFTPYVKKVDFLSGLNDNSYVLSFENTADSVSFTLQQFAEGDTARVLVQSGSDWYVSGSGLVNENAGAVSFNGYAETWYPYNPAINLFLNTSSLGSGVAGSELTDIQAFGVLMQGLHFNGTSQHAANFQITEMSANMVQSEAPSTKAIDFGGDYNDLNQTSNGESLTVALGDYEFGVNAIDDYAAQREITDAFVTIDNVNGLTNKTITFFGGAQYVNFDNAVTAPVVEQINYKWRGASDALQMVFDANATADSGMAFAPYVKKANFLNGFNSATQTLGFEDSASSVAFVVDGDAGMARALVQDGSDWYVSAATVASGSFNVNGYTETWYPYDPSENLFCDESNLGAGVAGSTLTDIQAAGVLMQRMHFDATANPTFRFASMVLKVAETELATVDSQITDDFNRTGTAWSSNGADIRSDWVVPGTNLWRINGSKLEAGVANNTYDTPIIYNTSLQISSADGASFTMSADVTAATNEQWCGVVFNYQNPSNYCLARIKTGNPSYHYIAVVDGANADTSLNNASANFDARTAYTFRVSGAGTGYSIEITEAGSSTVLNPETAWSPSVTLSDGYAGLLAPDSNLDLEVVPNVIFDNFALTVRLPKAPSTFEGWIGEYSVGSQTNLLDDFDGDGMDNLTEYALGGNPEAADVGSVLPLAAVDSDSGLFVYVYERRTDATDRGLTYTVKTDTDLSANTWTTNGVSETGVGVSAAGFESVTNTVSADSDAKFLRLQVEKAE